MSPLQGPVAVVIDAEQPGFSHYGAGKGVYRCQYTLQYSAVQYSTVPIQVPVPPWLQPRGAAGGVRLHPRHGRLVEGERYSD